MTIKIQLRRDTSANWALHNPVLAMGEPGLDTTTRQMKVGDGLTPWSALDYYMTGPAGESVKARRSDYAPPYCYCGTAPPGSSESLPVWSITRIQVNPDGSTTATHALGVEWTGRSTIPYA